VLSDISTLIYWKMPHNSFSLIEMVLPGSEIPKMDQWSRSGIFDQGVGSSVTIQVPSNCHQLIKELAFCQMILLFTSYFWLTSQWKIQPFISSREQACSNLICSQLGQFKRFRHAKYGAVLRESLSLLPSLGTPSYIREQERATLSNNFYR
jgi:hypothetical protein